MEVLLEALAKLITIMVALDRSIFRKKRRKVRRIRVIARQRNTSTHGAAKLQRQMRRHM